jgi:hypothetical protein
MKKLRARWGISSNFHLIIILIVFALTGSFSAKLAEPVTVFLGMNLENTASWIYWPIRILLIFPIYQVLLLFFGFIFGQFKFFWNFEKKMLSRMGLGFFFNDHE